MIRQASTEDLPLLQELWHEFDREIPPPSYLDDDAVEDLEAIEESVAAGLALVAEEAGEAVGFANGTMKGARHGHLDNLYVRPAARQSGTARALVHELVTRLRERGAEVVELEVLATNEAALTLYRRWGFDASMHVLTADAAALEQRLVGDARGRSLGSVHVQTDDRAAVDRAVAKVLPRLGRSAGTEVSDARNGWIAVYDELCGREPKLLQRLARELSYASGTPTLAIGIENDAVVRYTLYDRGGAVDEYLSVPEYYGPLPSGDVVALGANPTVVARLTGADPDRIREVARTAASPDELPPPQALLRELAETMGIEGAERGWEER